MTKLTSFTIEKLYYSLKLEVLDQMRPEDVIELVKVNAGFRSILVRKLWIVFGRHVHRINFCSNWILISRRPHDDYLRLDVARYFPMFKLIHSCEVLRASLEERFLGQNAAILNNLNSVKGLDLTVATNELLLKFLENFRLVIGKYACIDVKIDLLKENQVISELFKNFITNQIDGCEKVYFDCNSVAAFNFYYRAFAETSIKYFFPTFNCCDVEKSVQSIVENGIPSKNLKGAIYVNTYGYQKRDCRIIDFVSGFPGMERLDGENQEKVIRIANEIANEILNEDDYVGGHIDFTEKSDIFRRNIDSQDCVYIFESVKSCSGMTDFMQFIHFRY